MDRNATISALAEQSDLARGFAAISKGATRSAMRRKARMLHAAMCALYPVPSDVARMSDAELLAELREDVPEALRLYDCIYCDAPAHTPHAAGCEMLSTEDAR